jgi:gamma-glutamyl-gamma-aminobutyrate hydrolase PuuD
MANRPLIGLTTYRESIRWGKWHMPALFTPETYVSAVDRAGGEPLLLPTALGHARSAVLALVDGLLVVGGADIAAENYGERTQPETDPRPVRDRGELEALDYALGNDLPVLGVCRGMQLINVHAGGSLIQHLPTQVGHHEHLRTPGEFGSHPVRVDQASRISTVVGPRPVVTTYHHQGIGRLGSGLKAVAWADDGVIEAVESTTHSYVIGVQWHAERDDGTPLIEAFVEQCARRKAKWP